MLDFLEDLGHGIYAIDTGFQRPRFDAAYLMVEDGRAAFIDTGTNHAVPRLLAALGALGLAPDAVDWVIPTHVHLDHAGGVGLLMQSLPNARALVHPRGLRHMVDPKVLWLSALTVYGDEEMQRSYGKLVPVPAERAEASHDEQLIHLAGRPLRLIDSPGHAKHHHAIWDERSRSWFTGDTFGLSYPEFETPRGRYVLPTTTPVQFEPEPLKASIARMLERQPACMYLTHYSRIDAVASFADQLFEQIDAMVALARDAAGAPDRDARLRAGLGALYRARLRAMASPLSDAAIDALLAIDVELNAQGLGIWLDRQARDAAPRSDAR